MTLTIELNPEIEQGLTEQAQRKGLSLEAFAGEVLAREVNPANTGKSLMEAGSRVRGLLTDDEIDRMFLRDLSPARTIDFE